MRCELTSGGADRSGGQWRLCLPVNTKLVRTLCTTKTDVAVAVAVAVVFGCKFGTVSSCGSSGGGGTISSRRRITSSEKWPNCNPQDMAVVAVTATIFFLSYFRIGL